MPGISEKRLREGKKKGRNARILRGGFFDGLHSVLRICFGRRIFIFKSVFLMPSVSGRESPAPWLREGKKKGRNARILRGGRFTAGNGRHQEYAFKN
jgi:hypothetical protein